MKIAALWFLSAVQMFFSSFVLLIIQALARAVREYLLVDSAINAIVTLQMYNIPFAQVKMVVQITGPAAMGGYKALGEEQESSESPGTAYLSETHG